MSNLISTTKQAVYSNVMILKKIVLDVIIHSCRAIKNLRIKASPKIKFYMR